MYARPGSNQTHYYDTFEISVPTAGVFNISSNSSFDTYGFLYNGTFFPYSPFWNLAASDYDGAGNGQFRLTAYLQPYTNYTLVVTTFSSKNTGFYTVTISGSVRANIIPTTFIIINNNITAVYSSALTTSSRKFHRPGSSVPSYYEAIQLSVPITGTYTFKSDSSIDAIGYLYSNSFDPTDSSRNLSTEDDDSGGNQQFLITYDLIYGQIYFLIFTTYTPRSTTSFSITASGPGRADLIYYETFVPTPTTISK